MKISKQYFNHYKINDKPFELCDNILKFDDKAIRISPNFFKIVNKGNSLNVSNFTSKEKNDLNIFDDYAGGLERDRSSNLYKILKSFKQSNFQEIDGDGTTFIFLSSDPNALVERFEVLVGKPLAGNTNAIREASAILHEFLRMEEITENDHENAMKIFFG